MMIGVQAHRGPDGSGVWTAPGVGFGHRRLSIIDLGGGAQPMQSFDERITVTYNGEIYNFREVRTELERSEEHTSELQSLMRISYAVFCLQKKQRMETPVDNKIARVPRLKKYEVAVRDVLLPATDEGKALDTIVDEDT